MAAVIALAVRAREYAGRMTDSAPRRAKPDSAGQGRAAAAIKPRALSCRVIACDRLGGDIIRLRLGLPAGERLRFLAGQYIDILLSGGKRRSFSLANPPHEDQQLELHIRYYQGGLFSEYAFHDLREKALLRIEGPFGRFTLRHSGRPMIMIAGGTGFAPIKSLLEHALEKADKRAVKLYRGARAEPDLYLDALPRRWAAQHEHIDYIPVLSEPGRHSGWRGRTGLVHEAALADHDDLSAYDVYTCGPPPMIKAVVRALTARGFDKTRLFSDSFESAPG